MQWECFTAIRSQELATKLCQIMLWGLWSGNCYWFSLFHLPFRNKVVKWLKQQKTKSPWVVKVLLAVDFTKCTVSGKNKLSRQNSLETNNLSSESTTHVSIGPMDTVDRCFSRDQPARALVALGDQTWAEVEKRASVCIATEVLYRPEKLASNRH